MADDFQLPLFIFEMANNHMGSIEHGTRIIREFARVKEGYDFHFAFKFQLRDIDTFIHRDYRGRTDHNYVRRFSETRLSAADYDMLMAALKENGFISVCTGFDEPSVDLIEALDFDIIKVASCSFTDWPLLERIALTDKPIIASTAGSSLADIDAVVSFFQHREKKLAIMHCVGEYPTPAEHLELNQIDLLKRRYQGVTVGFSTHEDPENPDAVKIAIAKRARIFEKHVAVVTDKFPKNAYSSTPDQTSRWLSAAQSAFAMCGVENQRAGFSEKELADLHQFKRGVFASRNIEQDETIDASAIFCAFPNIENQLTANDMSKYNAYQAKKQIQANAPIMATDVHKTERREKVYAIVQGVKALLKKGNVVFPGKASLEISHHYGIDRFYEYGITMVTVVNRAYCKKLIILFPNQKHPEQYHDKKEETFVVLHGTIQLVLDGEAHGCSTGDVVTVQAGVKHAFSSPDGAIIEEISSTHYCDDSFYTDETIMGNPHRKTYLSYWID